MLFPLIAVVVFGHKSILAWRDLLVRRGISQVHLPLGTSLGLIFLWNRCVMTWRREILARAAPISDELCILGCLMVCTIDALEPRGGNARMGANISRQTGSTPCTVSLRIGELHWSWVRMLMIELLLPTFGRLVLRDDVGHLTSLWSSVVYIHVILLHVWVTWVLQDEVLRYLGPMMTLIFTSIVLTINEIVLISWRIFSTTSSSSCESGIRVIVLAVLRRSHNRAFNGLVHRSVVT